MNINYNADAILEAEIVDGKENIMVVCPKCGDVWQLEDSNVVLKPWSLFECPHCGECIPLF